MRARVWIIITVTFAIGGIWPWTVRASYLMPETTQAPVARLIGNLEATLKEKPDDVETLYYLARLHSMAYAVATNEIAVDRQGKAVLSYPGDTINVPQSVARRSNVDEQSKALAHLTNAISLYSQVVAHTNLSRSHRLNIPARIGYAWCLDQAGQGKAALAEYRKVLQIAWPEDREAAGNPSLRQWIENRWDDLRSWVSGEKIQPPAGRSSFVSDEIIGYMLALLNPKQDAGEIADIVRRQRRLRTYEPRVISPIIVPVAGLTQIEDLTNPAAHVAFDLDGSALPMRWGWPATNAAWLVYAPAPGRPITSGLQLFGSVTFWVFWRDGYAALSALDDNHDGDLTGPELDGLALWQDLNSNGISEPGEVRSLTDWHIVRLSCRAAKQSTGIPFSPKGVEFSDGRSAPTYDWVTLGEWRGSDERVN